MRKTRVRTNTIRTILVLLCAMILSLTGCSNGDKKHIAQLETRIDQLEKEKYDLIVKNNEIVSFFTLSKFKNHIYDCPNPFGGIQHVKFLSNSIVYVTGLDEFGDLMYNNYYIYNTKDKYTLSLVGELDMPDSIDSYSYSNLLKMADLLKTITFSQDFETITITPVDQYTTCRLKK